MSKIRGKNTRPEMMVRKFLFANGFRYRLHVKSLPGKPDIVLPKYKAVVQVHGCFWHGHTGCKYFKLPGTRADWWKAKIDRTRELDASSTSELEELGWQVVVVWECELKDGNAGARLVELMGEVLGYTESFPDQEIDSPFKFCFLDLPSTIDF